MGNTRIYRNAPTQMLSQPSSAEKGTISCAQVLLLRLITRAEKKQRRRSKEEEAKVIASAVEQMELVIYGERIERSSSLTSASRSTMSAWRRTGSLVKTILPFYHMHLFFEELGKIRSRASQQRR